MSEMSDEEFDAIMHVISEKTVDAMHDIVFGHLRRDGKTEFNAKELMPISAGLTEAYIRAMGIVLSFAMEKGGMPRTSYESILTVMTKNIAESINNAVERCIRENKEKNQHVH